MINGTLNSSLKSYCYHADLLCRQSLAVHLVHSCSQALTSLSIYLINVDTEICPTSSLTFIVLARCCFSLRFRFNYSSLVTDGLPPFNLTEYTEGDTERTRNLLIPLPVHGIIRKKNAPSSDLLRSRKTTARRRLSLFRFR